MVRVASLSDVPERLPLPGLSAAQLARIETRDSLLRERHLAIEGALSAHERDLVRRKRMIYRSKQRGWLEVDILLGSPPSTQDSVAIVHFFALRVPRIGSFGSKFVPTMSASELDEYELILREETVDTFNYMTGKDPLPLRLQGNGVMLALQKYASTSNVTSPESYAAIKAESNLI